MKIDGEKLFHETLEAITGIRNSPKDLSLSPPLGGESWNLPGNAPLPEELSALFLPLTGLTGKDAEGFRTLLKGEIEKSVGEAALILNQTPGEITDSWSRAKEAYRAEPSDLTRENLAKAAGNIWLKELAMEDKAILERWNLRDIRPNPRPLEPREVVLQLNALYTEPEGEIPEQWRGTLEKALKEASREDKKVQAEYDHPVPLFAPPEEHELESCLAELEKDLDFEKSRGVIPRDHKVPVIVSVSVTHPYLDGPAGNWLMELLEKREFQNIRLLFLTEGHTRSCQGSLFTSVYPVFSVMGRYSRHFNTLKYFQLLMERGYGCRGGFKLDTDEGIHSRDLFEVTGKTWMETLCHPFWGGSAKDWKGRTVDLGINEGEYVDSRDMDRLGYAGALREPDVKLPSSLQGEELFFPKGIAHARATALYNREASWENLLSHPVVKGGGYGITNDALRTAQPFTHSKVGRAEDQQFYFSALPMGVRGVFAPDLRIIHYKSAVAKSEGKTAAGRLIGDMIRLVLFQYLVSQLGIKEEIDPMPGVFASPLARPQALFHLLYRCWCYHRRGEVVIARELLTRGVPELAELKEAIDSGAILQEWKDEEGQWRRLVEEIDDLESEKVRRVLDSLFI